MQHTRHHHPHVDPRQPRNGARCLSNPPVFAWLPVEGVERYMLTVSRHPTLQEPCLQAQVGADSLYLPDRALPPGSYYWRWSADGAEGELFSFNIPAEATVVEVPPAAEWLAAMPREHPRIYIRPEQVDALRASRTDARAGQWHALQAEADALLAEGHEMPEPPFLGDRHADYEAWFRVWSEILWESRAFVKGAELLALAYLASGDERYGRAACRRMVSISQWDPEGSSHLAHNDEAHMSVIWDGAKAVDWVWELFTKEELAQVISQFRRRGEITYEHMHGRGSYGVTRFDSHAGREVVFLALLAMVFSDEIEQAGEWLEWLRPVLCGVWPIWAGDDGAWAEGPSYGLAYVSIMTMFASALKHATGVDLYRRPFWANHGHWRRWCWPPYAEWMGFGDHTERWKRTWESNANLVETIRRETGDATLAGYVEQFRAEAEHLDTPEVRRMSASDAKLYLLEPAQHTEAGGPLQEPENTVLRTFPGAGWAAVRTHIDDPEHDVAFIFRSSPYGSYSHSHANNNDFIIHVAGKVMAMPSGYYDGYGSAHHTHWNWHTKSHNCVTLSDASQLMRSRDSVGAVEHAFEDDLVAYMMGNADQSYLQAQRCRRHVLYIKPHSCFFLVDEFVAVPGVYSALQWNIHSWNQFDHDADARTFTLKRGASSLSGHIMHHQNGVFSLTEGWDPPPAATKPSDQWFMQYHLRYMPVGLAETRNLGVVLCPGHAALCPPSVESERCDGTEVAHLGEDLLLTSDTGSIAYGPVAAECVAAAVIGSRIYRIGDAGLEV